MVDQFGIADLGMFQATSGWSVLTEWQRSVFTAYLRRSETWPLASVLRDIEANVDLPSITPKLPVKVEAAVLVEALPMPEAPVPEALPPLNDHNQVPVVIPPTGAELAELRRQWDREWKRNQSRDKGKGKEEDDGTSSVTLTPEEVARVTLRARQRSAEVSGHGRAAHGGYASSSSAATLEADRERSERVAIQKALEQALARKRKGGTA